MNGPDLKRNLLDWLSINFMPDPKDLTLKVCCDQLSEVMPPLTHTHVKELKQTVLRTYDKWPGHATIYELATKIARGETAKDPPAYELPWTKPTDLCPVCEAWGHFTKDGREHRCDCSAGQQLSEDEAALFLTPPPPKGDPRIVPAAQTRRALAQICRVREGKPRKTKKGKALQ